MQGVVSIEEGGDPAGGVLIDFRVDNRGDRKGFERVFVAIPRRRRFASRATVTGSIWRFGGGVFVRVDSSSDAVSTIVRLALCVDVCEGGYDEAVLSIGACHVGFIR